MVSDGRAHAHERAALDPRSTTDHAPRPQKCEVAHDHVVLHHGARVDHAMRTNVRSRVDDGACHDHGSFPDGGARRYPGDAMDHDRPASERPGQPSHDLLA